VKSKEKRVEQTEGFRLSPHQTNIWRQIVAAPTCNFANQIAISIRGPLDVVRLRNAVRGVVLENEILRTRFVLQGAMSIPVQSIDDFAIPDFQFVDLSFLAGDDQQRILKEEWGNNLKRSNAMPQTVSVFYRLFKLRSNLHDLHVVSSALSSDLRGLCSLYEQAVLAYGRQYPATNRMQYADIAEWECVVSEGAGAEAGLSYWKDYTAQASGPVVVIQTEPHSG
jgi:hypothetical protein